MPGHQHEQRRRTVEHIVGQLGSGKGEENEDGQKPEPEEAEVSEKEMTIPSETVVFKTSNQTTRLKVTTKGLECYLEDSRPGKRSGHQWTLTKDQSKEILSSRDYRIYPGYKLYSGVFSIGPRKNWLYSKKLFPEPSLLELELERLLKNASK